MLQRVLGLLAVIALGLAAPARAFTPESGFWWAPTEPGSGITFEIQDNYVFMAGYVYDQTGRATWFTSQGLLTGNSRYTSVLDAFSGGQFIGGPPRNPVGQAGAGGSISITFTTETKATLVWGGRTIAIERFDYYLSRTGGIDPKTELMLGEWQVVLDLYTRSSAYQDYPYYGDIFAFDTIDFSRTPDQATGCRPTVSTYSSAPCAGNARTLHDAAASYVPSGAQTHVVVVGDVPASGSNPKIFLAYYLAVGTSQFDGFVEVCASGQCGRSGASLYPVRGFRTASRSFVQTGSGPSVADKAASTPSAAAGLVTSILNKSGSMPKGMSVAEAKARFGIDVEASQAQVQALIDGLAEK
jgi:hypothetical protein